MVGGLAVGSVGDRCGVTNPWAGRVGRYVVGLVVNLRRGGSTLGSISVGLNCGRGLPWWVIAAPAATAAAIR